MPRAGAADGGTPLKRSSRGFTLVELLIVVAIIGIVASIAIPNLLNAVDKGKQKRTMADLRTLGTAVESYAVDNVFYPAANSTGAIRAVIDPIYAKNMPVTDGWSHAFQVDSGQTAYTLYSQGKDGTGSDCSAGTTSTFNDEICFVNGQFMRYPIGTQR